MLTVYAAADESGEPEEDDGTDHGSNKVADDARRMNADEAEKPSAERTADNADKQIDPNAETATFHKFTGDKTGSNTNQNIPNKSHNNKY